MSGIKGRDTSPELAVRWFLHAHGFRYRLHVKDLPGTPDIVLPKYKTAIQVRGCFWHQHEGCRFAYAPKSNVTFWTAKLKGNVLRDSFNDNSLRIAGWKVITVWECEISEERLHRLIAEIQPEQMTCAAPRGPSSHS